MSFYGESSVEPLSGAASDTKEREGVGEKKQMGRGWRNEGRR
jgi:hypothetical protein